MLDQVRHTATSPVSVSAVLSPATYLSHVTVMLDPVASSNSNLKKRMCLSSRG